MADLNPFLQPFITRLGGLAVDIFFSLSGFLITTILLTERAKRGRVDVRAFYIRRTLRIWPNYYVAITSAIVLALILRERFFEVFLGNSATFWRTTIPAYVAFVGNWSPAQAPLVVGVLWSVCVEEQFYVLFPPTFVFSSRRLPVIAPVAFGLCFAVGFRAVAVARGYSIYHLTFCHADNLLLGALLSQVVIAWPDRVMRSIRGLALPAELASLVLVILFLWADDAWKELEYAQIISYSLSGVLTTFVVAVLAFGDGPASRMLSGRAMRFLGRLTYGMYCFHFYGLLAARAIVRRIPLGLGFRGVAITGFGLAFTIVIALACRIIYEDRCMRAKDAFKRVKCTPTETR
jgi:peptidoglycan/LPS O-acetylase OafA/YrhL